MLKNIYIRVNFYVNGVNLSQLFVIQRNKEVYFQIQVILKHIFRIEDKYTVQITWKLFFSKITDSKVNFPLNISLIKPRKLTGMRGYINISFFGFVDS